ncbi:hypothetical protein AV530_008073 [Patagioenas fasciata monilis]|uniref:Uncharacterized protein n=1 Tax=Patagioenas fasciata monilis TaxID=372326 RepID=A0A1V4KUE8_PATFA|nr:hypothetical protein AV530_008073 [Patagioenas fasciata monilis]
MCPPCIWGSALEGGWLVSASGGEIVLEHAVDAALGRSGSCWNWDLRDLWTESADEPEVCCKGLCAAERLIKSGRTRHTASSHINHIPELRCHL